MWIEVRQDVVVHRAERGLRPVFHAFVERVLDSTLEIWARVNGRDGRALLVGDLIELLAEYVRLHAESDQMYFGGKVFGDAGSGVKGNRQPDRLGLGGTVSVIQQKMACHVSTVDFESLMF